MQKAVARAVSISLLRLFNKTGVAIIQVASEEQADYLNECEGDSVMLDIGGGLTRLKDKLESGAEDQDRYEEFKGPFDLEADLGSEMKIRLCNSVFAANSSLHE